MCKLATIQIKLTDTFKSRSNLKELIKDIFDIDNIYVNKTTMTFKIDISNNYPCIDVLDNFKYFLCYFKKLFSKEIRDVIITRVIIDENDNIVDNSKVTIHYV